MPTTPSGTRCWRSCRPLGSVLPAQHLADRVGQAGDLAQSGGDAVDALRVERQPVEHRLGCARGAGGVQVLGVGARASSCDVAQARCRRRRAVRGSWSSVFSVAKLAGRDAGPAGGVVHLLAQVDVSRVPAHSLAQRIGHVIRRSTGVSRVTVASVYSMRGAGLRGRQREPRPVVHRRRRCRGPGRRSWRRRCRPRQAARAAIRPSPRRGRAPRCNSSPHSVTTPPPNSCVRICATTTSDSTAVVTVPGPSGAAAIVVDAGAREHHRRRAGRQRTPDAWPRADVQAVIADSRRGVDAVGDPDRDGARGRTDRREQRARSSSSTRRPPGATPHDLLALAELADVVVVNEAEAREWHWPVPHLVITRGCAGRQLPRRRTSGSTCPPPPSKRSTPPARATSSPECWPPNGSPGHEDALRRACAAGALATLVPGAGDCAPYAEAIDDVL